MLCNCLCTHTFTESLGDTICNFEDEENGKGVQIEVVFIAIKHAGGSKVTSSC